MLSKCRTSWGVLAAAGLVRSLNIRERGLRQFTQQIDYARACDRKVTLRFDKLMQYISHCSPISKAP